MLSSSVIKNVGQAAHYYSQQDNYYTREQGIEQSEWWGKGAEKLALSGQVDTQKFTDLLLGKLATGEQLGKMVEGSIKHRPGWDLTFSAPKSVSILALIGGDIRLLNAHRQAVSVALSHIERSCGQARLHASGGMVFQNTHNLVAALYHHDLSRAKDPQLHTHSVIMNMTERLDGKWRSLASKLGGYDEKTQGEVNGFIERVRHHNRYFSKLYETELAFRVQELGYQIKTDTKSGIFEIEGVPPEAIQFFSKRRAEIQSKLTEKGLSGGKAAAIATLDTRHAKENVDRPQLKEQWEREATTLGLDCQQIIESSQHKKMDHVTPQLPVAGHELDAVTQAAKSLSVFQSTFTLEEVVTVATEYAIRQNLNVESLLSAVAEQIAAGELLSLPNKSGKTVLMAKSTLDEEKRLFAQLENNKSAKPTLAAADLKNHLEKHIDIQMEHHGHLETLFGTERIVLIEGEAARDIFIEPVMKIAKTAGLNVALLSPSLAGSKQFANAVKQEPKSFWEQIKALFIDSTPKHYSVMQFLSLNNGNGLSKQLTPDIVLVDNAQLLSTHQQANLFEWNKNHNSKLILLGNKTTLLSQQRGVSIDQLSERGVSTISMKSNEDSLVHAVEEKNMQAVVDKMTGRMVEVKLQEDRHHAMANHYSKLSENDRQQSWLVAQTKKTVSELNQLTHQSLLDQGKLGKTETINVLIPVFLPEGKGVLAPSYQKGQVVRFNEAYSTLPVSRGEYLRVVRHSKISNRVVLQKENGEHLIWQPEKIAGGISGKVEVFNEQSRELAVNETIMVNRSLPSKKMVKGERLTITAINQQRIKLKNSEGQMTTLDLSKPYHRHIDYGYAATLHAIAHEKPAFLLADLPRQSFHTDQRRFYQAVLQPKEAWVYTDDQKGLTAHLEKKTGDRLTAHATLSQSQELKINLHSLHHILEKQIAEQKGRSEKPAFSRMAVEAVEYAMHHLAEREAGFTHKQLMQTAMTHALGKVTAETLNSVTVAMEKAGIVLRGERSDGTLWTTVDAVKIEREIMALCNQDKGKLEPIASDELLEKYCDPAKLKLEQIAAVRAITQSKDRVMAVQGHPGTGKTTMLATVADVLAAKNLLTGEGYQILGLAPTHTAVKELTERGIPAQTLDSFIFSARKELADSKQPIKRDKLILVIDESSMVSNRKMVEVLQIAHQLACRGVIPTGDTRQLPAIESGKPFALVQNQVNTSSLVDIRRQSDKAPALKQAVKETIRYDFKAALEVLKDSIIEVPPDPSTIHLSQHELRMLNRQERVNRLVKDYFSFAKEARDNIQVITPGHDDRALANTLIREGLKAEGTLAKDADQSFYILKAKSLTRVERAHITNFTVGDVLRFGRRESAQIKSGDYFTIVKMNATHSLLTLRGGNGREVPWQVPTFDKKHLSSVEVFQKESRDLQVGDVIRWSRSDKKNELLGTEAARVTAIEQNKVTVELANKRVFTLDANKASFQHWDHGYAATVYAVQGKTKEIILAHMESFRANLTNQPGFLVALTRAVNVFRLYTDDIQKLLQAIERNTGIKLSSLEVIGEFPEKVLQKIQEKTSQTKSVAGLPTASKREKIRENRPYFDRYSIERIKEGLNKEAEKIAVDILGTPKEKGSHYLKFGSHQGSLTVTIKGEKQGWFNDFETNKGGRDMLRFIQVHGGMGKREAIQYGANWLGILPDKERQEIKIDSRISANKPDLGKEKSPASFSDYAKSRIRLANKIAKESLPLKGTLAEKYLTNHRGIDLDNVPEDIRFHPHVYSAKNQKALPALIAIARNREGKIQSVEAIYLDAKTADKAHVPLAKQTIGSKKGAVVIINQTNDKNAPTLIAEGVVTGLSLAKSLPQANIRITLGKQMFGSIDPAMLSKKAIFCLDNDGKNLKTDGAILAAANRLTAAQKEVSFMVPTGLEMKKQDYNDILKQRGQEAIQNDFHRAIPYKDFYKNNDSSSSMEPTKLAQLSKEVLKAASQQDKAHLHAYQSMVDTHSTLSADKTLSKIIDTERQI